MKTGLFFQLQAKNVGGKGSVDDDNDYDCSNDADNYNNQKNNDKEEKIFSPKGKSIQLKNFNSVHEFDLQI